MMVSNQTPVDLRKSEFNFDDFDAAPKWLRMILAHHPYNVHVSSWFYSYAKNLSAASAIRYLREAKIANQELVQKEALRLYGPDHPQAKRANP
jgi:hypothetical protein